MDDEGRLHFRDVTIVRPGREEVVLRAPLDPGDRIVVSALEAAVEGMRVRAVSETQRDSLVAPASPELPRVGTEPRAGS